jgi:hypothetical protein
MDKGEPLEARLPSPGLPYVLHTKTVKDSKGAKGKGNSRELIIF